MIKRGTRVLILAPTGEVIGRGKACGKPRACRWFGESVDVRDYCGGVKRWPLTQLREER
jgi:hypothetical protein